MQAIVLVGGRGTRLRPYTTVIPKPLLPLGDMPIVEVIIRQLRRCGFDDLVLCTGYLGEMFRAFLGAREEFGKYIRFVLEPEPLGTAGALALVDDLQENFLVINGDTLTTLDYRALMSLHLESKAAATIATHEREEKVDFGVIETDGNGCLSRYIEKPVHRYQVSMGVNILSRGAMAHLPRGKRKDMPDLLLDLVGSGQKVLCHKPDCTWLDIGRPSDYDTAQQVFEERRSDFLGSEA